jgi:hypothetical protein
MAHPTDVWSPEFKRMVREYKEDRARRQRVLNGRTSIAESQPVPGVGIAYGIFAGAAIPIMLTKPIGKPKSTGERTAVDSIRIPIQSQSEKNMLTADEQKVIAITGQTEQQFLDAKRWNGRITVNGRARSFPDADHNGNFDDNRGRGAEMKPARDGGALRGGTEKPKLPPGPNAVDQPSDLDQAAELTACALGRRDGKCDHGDIDHIAEARRLLNRDKQKRGGTVGVKFVR